MKSEIHTPILGEGMWSLVPGFESIGVQNSLSQQVHLLKNLNNKNNFSLKSGCP